MVIRFKPLGGGVWQVFHKHEGLCAELWCEHHRSAKIKLVQEGRNRDFINWRYRAGF